MLCLGPKTVDQGPAVQEGGPVPQDVALVHLEGDVHHLHGDGLQEEGHQGDTLPHLDAGLQGGGPPRPEDTGVLQDAGEALLPGGVTAHRQGDDTVHHPEGAIVHHQEEGEVLHQESEAVLHQEGGTAHHQRGHPQPGICETFFSVLCHPCIFVAQLKFCCLLYS